MSRHVALIRQLGERDQRLLAHVDRYRLATTVTLRQAVTPELSSNAVAKIVQRLCAADWLCKYPLNHPECYFVLGRVGAAALGRSRERTRPLGPQSLPQAFAVLLYAVCGRPPRRRLLPAELGAACQWLPSRLALAPHCGQATNRVIELVRVDLGGPAHHVARKCAADITARSQFPEFVQEVEADRFRLVVITAAPEKGTALRQALDRHAWPVGLAIHLAVIPALLSVLPRKAPHA